MTEISIDTCMIPCRNVAVRQMGDAAVVVNLNDGACFELNRVGFEIWQLLATGATGRAITETLAKQYGVAEDRLTIDVLQLFSALLQHKLIESASPAHAGS